MPSLQTLLRNKTAFIEAQQQQIENLLIDLGNQFASDFTRIVGRGVFDFGVVLDALDALGYTDAILARVRLQGETIQSVLNLSREVSQTMGLNFALTATNEAQLAAYLEAVERKMLASFREEIAADMTRFAFEARLAQTPTKQIINQVRNDFEARGRFAGTELNTALSIFDRATMGAIYENEGVEKYFYFPPNIIETSRPSCIAAVADPRQQTGWTREDIQNEPELDFIRGGKPYFNCRHEWIPFEFK